MMNEHMMNQGMGMMNHPVAKGAMIAATGYTGYLGHEFIPRGEPVAGLRAAFELAKLA